MICYFHSVSFKNEHKNLFVVMKNIFETLTKIFHKHRYINKSPVRVMTSPRSSSFSLSSPVAVLSLTNNSDTTMDAVMSLSFTLQEYHFRVSTYHHHYKHRHYHYHLLYPPGSSLQSESLVQQAMPMGDLTYFKHTNTQMLNH